jgi:hypothetical protein
MINRRMFNRCHHSAATCTVFIPVVLAVPLEVRKRTGARLIHCNTNVNTTTEMSMSTMATRMSMATNSRLVPSIRPLRVSDYYHWLCRTRIIFVQSQPIAAVGSCPAQLNCRLQPIVGGSEQVEGSGRRKRPGDGSFGSSQHPSPPGAVAIHLPDRLELFNKIPGISSDTAPAI